MLNRNFNHTLNRSQLNPGDDQLIVENISLTFGGVQALRSVSLTARQQEITAIIGPNGAGKTSLLNCISGLYHPQQGAITYQVSPTESHDLTKRKAYEIAKLGLARSFQNIELFKNMSVLDNLMLGRHVHLKSNFWQGGLYWGQTRKEEMANRHFLEDIIDLLEIETIRKQPVGTLSYGLQKRVELGRALALQPALLVLDEPMAGMNSEEKEDMARFILDVNEEHGVSMMIIEHDMSVVMDISDYVIVLNFGEKIGDGTPDEVQRDPQVIQAYLGQEFAKR